jgi:hypothetical protein
LRSRLDEKNVSNLESHLTSSHKRKFEATPRVLHFHTGTWKTGSTALQAHLESNKSQLAEAGISYEFRPDANHKDGNGRYLAQELFDRQLSHATLDSILEDYFADQKIAICSSEDFTRFRREEWEQILDASWRLACQVRTITYVRDVGPYYGSLHAQLFKAGQHYAGLQEFCAQDCYRTVLDSLRCLYELFGRESMTVIHYESEIDRIDAPFMADLDIDPDGFDRSMLTKRSNRSFSKYEMEALRNLIKRTGGQFAPELAILLLERRPDLEPDRMLDPNLIKQLELRHHKDLLWLNEVFFNGANVVRILADTRLHKPASELSAEDRRAIDADIVDWCISKLESAQEAGAAFIATRLAAIDWRNIGNPSIPGDFDPIAYLLLNLDVLKAGVPPCEHYINSGQHEKGRRWRWESR